MGPEATCTQGSFHKTEETGDARARKAIVRHVSPVSRSGKQPQNWNGAKRLKWEIPENRRRSPGSFSAGGGDGGALERLIPLVPATPRDRAALQAGERAGLAFRLRRSSTRRIPADRCERVSGDRAHFLAVAARVMRRILVDRARGACKAWRRRDAVTFDEGLWSATAA